MRKSSNLTVEFLNTITSHLSGRKDCRQVEYLVCIGMIDSAYQDQISNLEISEIDNKVFFFPKRTVFPDIHHRRQSDSEDIIHHVVKSHFADDLYDYEELNAVCIKPDQLESGIYKYVLSFDGKKRQWIRIK